MTYYYPDAKDALTAKKQFLKEHHYYAKHCFRNIRGTGYVIFYSKEEVNLWWKEHTGGYFYDAEYIANKNNNVCLGMHEHQKK